MNQKATGGIGVMGAITILFVALKLCRVLNWSWVWVLGPIWIPFAAGAAAFIFFCLWVGIQYLWDSRRREKRKKAHEAALEPLSK